MQNIKKEYYTELDNEFKKKYAEYTGVDPSDTSYSKFSQEHQIERYARNIAFWQLEQPNIDLNSDGKLLARSFMVSNALSSMIQRMHDNFDKKTQKKIMKRVEELIDPVRCSKINEIKKKLEIMHNISQKFYEDAKNEIEPDQELPNPTNWIYNQNKMRGAWDNMRKEFAQNKLLKEMMLNNSFGRYMEFMYNSYPPNFGSEIIRCEKEYGYCDRSKVYYNLTN